MPSNRRQFLSSALASGVSAAALPLLSFSDSKKKNPGSELIEANYAKLDAVLAQPIFKKEFFSSPVIIDKLELLHFEGNFICRVRSKDGVEGYSVGHSMFQELYPIFINYLQPMFIGQDARRMDDLMDKAIIYNLNYRFNGAGIGVPLATIEFALLDMMGKIAGKPVGQLIGDIKHPTIPVYQATEFRERPVAESVELIKAAVDRDKALAVKIKVGALMFMTKDLDAKGPAGRTEEIIPLIRKTFGDKMPLYADANGFYDVKEAIRVGKLLEEYKYSYFEEPVQYDWFEETKKVKDALKIPIALGEQEHTIHGFRWHIANNGIDIVQPDQYYFGGMIRSMKIARMAASMGKICTPHLSGGFGYIYMLHFMSAVPNAGPHIEFKGYTKLPIECKTSSLKVADGVIKVPTGPGIGVEIDPAYIKKCSVVKATFA